MCIFPKLADLKSTATLATIPKMAIGFESSSGYAPNIYLQSVIFNAYN